MRRGLLLLSLLWIVSATIAQTRPFVVGSVDKSSPYVGEPILYSLKLYYQGEIGERFVSEPSFVGFGRSRVVFEALAYSETFEGVNYSVLEQRYLLYPLRAGTLTIEPFQIDIAETPFDPAWTVFTDDLSITVLPYPEPIPDDFTNGIGQFTVSADASPKNVQTGDALTWTITISGTGNLEQLLAPTLVLPESWRLFDAEVTYEQDNLRFGRTIFSWRVIVGDYSVSSLPAVSFSYFNPQTEQYESRISAPIPLNIMVVTAQP
ncbi:MAG: BatD family protein, partial [Chloroflexota bacterium]